MVHSSMVGVRRSGQRILPVAAFLVAMAPVVSAAQGIAPDTAKPDDAAVAQPAPTPTPTPTPNVGAANELLRQGLEAYKNKDYSAARTALLEAYRLDPVSPVAAMLADVEMKLKLFREAAEHWTIYLDGVGPDKAAERAEILTQIENCRKQSLSAAKLTLSPSNAELLVDGAPIDLKLSGGDLWLEPGVHTFEVKSPGTRFEPVTIAGPRDPQWMQAPTTAESEGLSAKSVVVIGGTVLTAMGATVSGLYWLKTYEDGKDADALRDKVDEQTRNSSLISADSACASSNPPDACGDLHRANEKADRTSRIAAYTLLGTGAVGLATIGTYLLWPTAKSAPKPAQSGLVVAPWFAPESRGVAASMRF